MPYYSRADADAVDDFDEYDPTPYGGGYDLHMTFGRPIPPGDDTCYPMGRSASDEIDYDRPHFSSHSEPSAYGDDALTSEYSSYSRPKPRPGPAYGSGGAEYGRRTESEYEGGGGSEYGRRKQGYGEEDEGYERRHETAEYGSGGYRRQDSSEKPAYGRRRNDDDDDEGYGRKKYVRFSLTLFFFLTWLLD
ncbi:unnamed protein product [Linum tenue]|uniref:Uncharacterized protein n=1 Tax=Linum tenue TaxID=586396 RepID=A0AAV0IYF8_9ROSI|nr:unnamed protein product [Linum tenue]